MIAVICALALQAAPLEATPAGTAIIDLNTATVQQLDGLPGIGRRKAEAIIAFRARHPFRRPTELMRVRGVGRKLYERLRPAICAGTACSAGGSALLHGALVEVSGQRHGEQERAQSGHQP